MNKRFFLLGFFISLFFIIFTSYTPFLDIPYNAKRLAQGFLLLLGAGVVCSSKIIQEQWVAVIKRFGSRKPQLTIAIGVVFGLGIISSLLANQPNLAFIELSHYFLLINFMLLAAICYRYNSDYFEIGVLSMIGVTAALYLINVSISYLYIFLIPYFPIWPGTDFPRVLFEDVGFFYPEPFLNFVHVRFFNHLQTLTLPLISLLVVYIPQRYWAFSKLAFIVACGWWMLVFASDARGTTLASFLTLVFIFLMYKDKAREWLRAYSSSAGIGLALYFLFFKLLPLNVNGGRTAFSRYGDSGRFEIWEYAISLIIENPLFGVGPMHFTQIGAEVVMNPHNIYLQIASEWGLIAGVLFITIVASGFYYWLAHCNKIIESSIPDAKGVTIRVALTASVLATLIHAFFTNNFNTPLSQIMMVLVVGWMVGLLISDDVKLKYKSGFFWESVCLITVNLLVAGFLIFSYVKQVPNLDENRLKYLEITQKNKLIPRYWDQGVIWQENHNKKLNDHSTTE